MGLATTFTDIANLALKSLGHEIIQSIDADESTARLLKNYIDEIARQIQVDIHWPELLRVIKPTKLADNFAESNTYFRYQLPEDFIQMVEMNSSTYYEIFDGALITQAVDPQIIYKAYSGNVADWSAELVELTYKKLASEIAMAFTQNVQLVQMATAKYEERKRELHPIMKNRSRDQKKTLRRFSYMNARGYYQNGINRTLAP